jgi:SAM-dependent methyltransferase
MTDERRVASMPKGVELLTEGPGGPGGPGEGAERAVDSDPSGDSLTATEPLPAEVPTTPSRRPRMALRIPDDEVARPEPREGERARSEPPLPSFELPPESAPLLPMRIITINPPPPPPAPQSAEHVELGGPVAEAVAPAPPGLGSPPAPPAADGLEDGWSADDDRPTPVPATPVRREPAPPEPDGEEVRFDEETPTPALPAVVMARERSQPDEPDEGRKSEPGDAPEVSLEDLVAVEPVPERISVRPVPPPKKAPPKPPLVIVPPHAGSLVPQPVDTAGSRRKGRLWWEDFFNDDYIRTMEKVTDRQIEREVTFIEESLGVERGSALLDLACGTGRHAVELAARGYEMVGFDLSLAMLARAGDEAQDRGVKMNFVQGDMREMTFEEQFDAVFSWNTSFGYFEEEKNLAVVGRVHKSLKTGGMFLLDVANRDFLVRQSPSLAWFEGDGCVCMDEMVMDFITSRMRVKRTMMLDDGRTREIEYSIRTYGLHELGKLLHDSGFKVCEVSGRITTPGVYFGQESPRTIILAEKR